MATLYRRKQDVLLRTIAGEHLLISCGSDDVLENKLMMLSETGAFLWHLLETDVSLQQLVAECLEEYDADREVLKQDVESFLNELLAHRLVLIKNEV